MNKNAFLKFTNTLLLLSFITLPLGVSADFETDVTTDFEITDGFIVDQTNTAIWTSASKFSTFCTTTDLKEIKYWIYDDLTQNFEHSQNTNFESPNTDISNCNNLGEAVSELFDAIELRPEFAPGKTIALTFADGYNTADDQQAYALFLVDQDSTIDPTFETLANASDLYPQWNSRFLDLQCSVSGQDLVLTADYFIDINEIDTNNPLLNPTGIRFGIAPESDSTLFSFQTETIATSTGSTSQTAFIDRPTGKYNVSVTFSSPLTWNTGFPAFGFTNIHAELDVTSGGSGNCQILTESILDQYDPIESWRQYQSCSISDLYQCALNIGRFLFAPTDFSITTVKSSIDSLKEQAPISYFVELNTTMSDISATPHDLGTLNLTFATGTPFTFDAEILSQDTVEYYVSSSVLTLISGLITTSVFVSVVLYIYRRARTVFFV